MGSVNAKPILNLNAQITFERFLKHYGPVPENDEARQTLLGHVRAAFASVHQHATSLSLNFHHSFLGDKATQLLLKSLYEVDHKTLSHLSLRSVGLTPACGAAPSQLPRQLSLFPHLIKLDLSFNALGPDATTAVLTSLCDAPALATLLLSQVEASDFCSSALVSFLMKTKLTRLDISNNKFTKVTGEKLVTTLAKVSSLADFNVNGNDFGDALHQGIQKKIQRNRICSQILEGVVSEVLHFQYQGPKKERVKRKDRHWTELLPTATDAEFDLQFPKAPPTKDQVKKMKKKAANKDDTRVKKGAEILAPQDDDEKKRAARMLAYPKIKLPHPVASARFHVGHHEAVGERDQLEDAILIRGRFRGNPNEDLYGVFDGHGGPHVAAYATTAFPLVFERKLARDGDDVESALRSTFLEIDQAVGKWARWIGSTGVVAYINHNTLWVANVGDSRAVVSHDGRAIQLSYDHAASVPEEEDRIVSEGGVVMDGRVGGMLAVSRSFGDQQHKPFVKADPHIQKYELTRDDHFLLLGCDGVNEAFTNDDAIFMIEDAIAKEGVVDPAKWAPELVEQVLNYGSMDNVSVLLVCLSDQKLHEVPVTNKIRKQREKLASAVTESS